MNPIFSWIIAHTVGEMETRRCPQCQRNQIVSAKKKERPVTCHKCGAHIPPKS